MTDSEIYLVYTTFPDLPAAKALCDQLLEERLIACANFIPNIQALFRWEGQVGVSPETIALLKTSRRLYPQLEDRIRRGHPYACPCILAFTPQAGLAEYMDWIHQETQ